MKDIEKTYKIGEKIILEDEKECDNCMKCQKSTIMGNCCLCNRDINGFENAWFLGNNIYCRNCFKIARKKKQKAKKKCVK